METSRENYLVLCVDRDDDLGSKAGIETPVVGRDKVIEAATKLSLSDPEEADANAMFAAVREYDRIIASGAGCEVAVVSGDKNGGFEADKKIRKQVNLLVSKGLFSGIIFVSDGVEDETIIPIIQDIKPIVSIKRVVIKHSQSVEETYQILGRYLRMLVYDPRYSKWALGVPGLILLLSGFLIILGRVLEAELATLLIIGGTLFVRGFGFDRMVSGYLRQGPHGYVRLFTLVTSSLVLLVAVTEGYDYLLSHAGPQILLVSSQPSLLLVYGAQIVGYFISGSLALLWVSIGIYASGSLLVHVMRGSVRAYRDAVVIVMLGLLYLPIQTFSSFLIGGQRESTILLVSYILFGLAVIFGLSTYVYSKLRQRQTSGSEKVDAGETS
jgi:putative membrane protein